MFFRWLKRYMPRSLYGRAALILVLPVVTLQLVVSVVFIQRHFEGVSAQMSREVARAVNLALDEAARDGTGEIARGHSPDGCRTIDELRGWYARRDAAFRARARRRPGKGAPRRNGSRRSGMHSASARSTPSSDG